MINENKHFNFNFNKYIIILESYNNTNIFIRIIMGGSFSIFDNDDAQEDISDKMDDYSDIHPPNEITIRKRKRISKEYDDDVLDKSDMRKTKTRNRDKRKKTRRKRVSFQLEKNED